MAPEMGPAIRGERPGRGKSKVARRVIYRFLPTGRVPPPGPQKGERALVSRRMRRETGP
jgi:hypothetical protein